MHKQSFPYSEDFLQWIWENMLFDTQNLKTASGKNIVIHNQGTLNTTDGPDFKNASIEMDGVLWRGSVEMHLKSRNWNQHNHQFDKNYDRVILHVVVEEEPKEVFQHSGGSPETLNLLPVITEELRKWFSNYKTSKHLPCVNGLHYISADAFVQQIEKAHHEYFEKKVDDFLGFYDPELLPIQAWKHALIISIFDGFGITHNREAMRTIGEWFLSQPEIPEQNLIQEALRYSEINSNNSKLNWNYRGVRPGNHPKKRIEQAIKLALQIQKTPIDSFYKNAPIFFLTSLAEAAGVQKLNRTNIIYGTVFLPAIYLLGSVLGAVRVSEIAYDHWKKLQSPIPKVLLKKFEKMEGIQSSMFAQKLGSIHQLNAYCNSRRCSECFVLKNAILS